MSDIVNLRMVRKRKARADKEQLASENRALHGRTRAEKDRDRAVTEKTVSFVEAHRRETKGDSEA